MSTNCRGTMIGILPALHWMTAAGALLVIAHAVQSDARRLIIPNWTSAAIAAAFLPAAWLSGLAPGLIGIHYATGAALFAAGAALFALGYLGGGDVKLLAAGGVWAGLTGMGGYLMLTVMLGGVLALAILAARRLRARVPVLTRIPWLTDDPGQRQAIPYGIAIGVAAIIVLFRSPAAPPGWAAAVGL